MVDTVEFVVVENLPLLETGIDYPASTGPFSVTRPMIQSAIEYTQDPHGNPPRIKIAHGDSPINSDLQSLFEQYNDGRDASMPSLGTILNLRTFNDGHTLSGDWYGLPAWLAEILSSAYPARSIEGGAWTNPANNKNYDFMIEAVSLLGVVGPGCTSLADIQALFSNEGPQVTVIEMSPPKMGGSSPVPAVNLQVNVEELRRSFYDQFAQGDRYWWWDRELLADPWEFIAMDEEGQLWRVPFSPSEDANGDTSVSSWGDPEPIKINYVDDPKRQVQDGVAASARLIGPRIQNAGTVLAFNSTPPEGRVKKEAKAAVAIDIPALRTRLKMSAEQLPDDASEEQINDALAAEPEPETETEPDPEETETKSEVETTEDGFVKVDAEAWRQHNEALARLTKSEEERKAAANADVVALAIKDRKIPPSRKDHYLALMKKDAQGTRQFLDSLEKDAVPGPELGTSAGEENTSGAVRGTGLLPELTAKEA